MDRGMDRVRNTGANMPAYNEENAYNEPEKELLAGPQPNNSSIGQISSKVQSEMLTLGMGCFWSPEALFGHVPGVLRTRVGYAGGTTEHPTYREMGDHSETVEVEFDPDSVTLEQLLELFWKHHKPVNINGYKGRQYWSLVLYRNDEQRETIERVKRRLELEGGVALDTEIASCQAFYPAEARHQKYYLKRFPNATAKLGELYGAEEHWADTALAARLNGLAKGFTSMERIAQEIEHWDGTEQDNERLIHAIRRIRW